MQRNGTMEKHRMIQRPEREFIRIAVPAVLESLINVLITAIDTGMIAPLGAGAVSAVSLTTQPKLLFLSVFYALGTAVSIFVSQAMGKEDREEANAYFHAVLRAAVVLSLILGTALAVLAEPAMHLFSRQQETMALSVSFFRIIMAFMVFQCVQIVLSATLRGIGETRATLISGIFMAAADLLLNYLLIEGHWGFPALGVVGNALGTAGGMIMSCAVCLFFLKRRGGFLTLKGILKKRGRQPEVARNIRQKAGNTAFENLFTRIGFLISSVIVSTLPADETAVYFVGMILLNYTFAFGDGLQNAVVALTGRSMGKRQVGEVEGYVRQGLFAGTAAAAVLSILYIVGARWFYGSYFPDASVVDRGARYNYIVAALTFLQILRIVNIAGMRGMGETALPRKIATICVLIINPLSSWLLAVVFKLGVWGIWIASLITQVVWFVAGFAGIRHCLVRLKKAD